MQQCFAKNEKEKKWNYYERIINVDNGSFTPLIFSIHGGIARECSTFYSRLSEFIANKKNAPFSITVSWIRKKICFALLSSSLLCLRGSRNICFDHESVGREPIQDWSCRFVSQDDRTRSDAKRRHQHSTPNALYTSQTIWKYWSSDSNERVDEDSSALKTATTTAIRHETKKYRLRMNNTNNNINKRKKTRLVDPISTIPSKLQRKITPPQPTPVPMKFAKSTPSAFVKSRGRKCIIASKDQYPLCCPLADKREVDEEEEGKQ